jgi:hypothetical protein
MIKDDIKDDARSMLRDAFNKLSRDSELSLADYSHISSCQHEIDSVFARYYTNFTSVLPGAYSRHTMTAPLAGSVIDMFVLFKEKHSESANITSLLERFKNIIKPEYPDSWLAKRTSALIVKMDNFVFRIQPGFVTGHSYYLVPAQTWDGWEKYDSMGYKNAFARMNAKHKGRLVHVIRMIKTWNRLNGSVFDDYYLELMTVDLLKDYQIEDYADTLCHVFRSMVYQVVFRKTDPACVGMDVEGLRDVEDLVMAMQLVHTAYRTAKQAIEFTEKSPMSTIAFTNWEKLFPGMWQHTVTHA